MGQVQQELAAVLFRGACKLVEPRNDTTTGREDNRTAGRQDIRTSKSAAARRLSETIVVECFLIYELRATKNVAQQTQ